MMRYLLSFCFVLATGLLLAQTSSQRAAVLVSATAQSSPPRITLSWPSMASTTSLTIYRKLKSGTSWGSAIATPAASDLSWQDNTVTVGTAYEYRIVRVSNGVTGNGYISTGVEVAPIDFRGKLILLVDNTIASSLSSELLQLEQDLRADGWGVLRSDVSPSASVTSVRATVIGHYNSDPANVKAVYIIGHVPVPYSGNQNPDGHAEHSGAWPCDGYYGELNGTWTDNTVNSGGMQRPQNTNVPGDGKFDQSTFPNPVELQVGRVDLSDLPAFSTSNVELMRNYLNKAHGFKTKAWTPQARGIMFDNLQWVGNPLAASGWRAMGPLVGASNITTALQAAWPFYTLVDDSYLWTYSSGGGGQETTQGVITYHGAANVGSVHDYAASPMNGVFNMAFGSYFGDWDNKNNFLRAPLASGQALTNVWSAIPGWYFHHMGQGENIGYSTWITMNNTSLYQPLTDGWQGSIGKCHLGLMGDPSLRMIMLAPPQNLTVNNSGGNAAFSWTASTEPGLAGYHIYEFQTDGAITRLTTSPVAGTSYTNPAIPFVAGKQYMVRAVKLESGFSGSYFNLSLGAIGTASGGGPVNDCLGVPGGTAVPGAACNDNNPCTTNDAWNASCQCVGAAPSAPAISSLTSNSPVCAGGTLTFTLTASGAGPLAYAWTGPNGFASTAQNPAITSVSTLAAGTYTVVVSNSCGSAQQSLNVAINSQQSATITYAGSPFCTTVAGVSVTRTGPSGGTYSVSPAGLSINTFNGNIAPVSSAAGNYTVTYTLAAAGGCPAFSTTASVVVTAAPSATIAYSGSPFCTSSAPVSVTRTGTAGGSYSASPSGLSINASTGAITPAASTPGTYTVTYAIAAAGGCAAFSTTANVAITAATGGTTTASACDAYTWGVNGMTYTTSGNYTAGAGCSASTLSLTIIPSTIATTSISACGDFLWSVNGTLYTASGTYTDVSGCHTEVLNLVVVVPGTACNDNDASTGNDTWNANCQCVGQTIDCLGVAGGSALPGSACNDNNANTINDTWSANCQCVGTAVTFDCLGVANGTALPGTACDDNNAATGNDTWNANCQCVGQTIDCLGVAGGSALPGSACNDNNANTINDTWSANCQCVGTAVTFDCLGVANGTALPGTACDDNNAATGNDTWNANCQCVGQTIDCLGVAGGSALPGTTCNDNNASTINDAWSANCQCVGTAVTFDCLGVANGTALPGTACDDNNASTGNDTWNANCQCVGQTIDCVGVAGGSALPGTACNDNNANTINDAWSANCQCVGTAVTFDCLGVANGTALPGTACNDNNAATGNDTWNANCQCVGQTIDCLGVAGGSALPGSACNDNNANTINDAWSANCQCVGTAVTFDCLGVANGTAMQGTPCDDGDPETGNDTWNANCECVGLMIDCTGTIGGSALIGTPCDDGNSFTVNDSWNSQCFCIGVLSAVDCAGVINGNAFIDACGQCAGGSTGVVPNPDSDADGVLDCEDNCSTAFNPNQADFDADGVGDSCDNCVWVYNPDQADANSDGAGDVCDITTALEEARNSDGLVVAPNPSRGGLIRLSCSAPEARGVRLVTTTGQLVFETAWHGYLDIDALSAGIYFIVALDAEGRPLAHARFVKQ